jgi:hypothetical protein
MNTIKTRLQVSILILLGVFLLLLSRTPGTSANSGYAIEWFDVHSSAVLSGDGFRLMGTAGQAETEVMREGTYKLGSGFWADPNAQGLYQVFLPVILRNP